jgi:hypothetical protein
MKILSAGRDLKSGLQEYYSGVPGNPARTSVTKVTTNLDLIHKLAGGRFTDLLGQRHLYIGQRQTLRRCDAGHSQSTAQKTSRSHHRPTSFIREPFVCNPDRFSYTSTLSLASFFFVICLFRYDVRKNGSY